MGRWYDKARPRKPSKHSARKHKKRAQKRKERMHGIAAFAQTNAGNLWQRKRQHSGSIDDYTLDDTNRRAYKRACPVITI